MVEFSSCRLDPRGWEKHVLQGYGGGGWVFRRGRQGRRKRGYIDRHSPPRKAMNWVLIEARKAYRLKYMNEKAPT